MGVIKLLSTNQELSFVIGKNPQSGMVVKRIRNGTAFGWYTPGSVTEWNAWFKDDPGAVSYKEHPEQCYEHMTTLQYTSPLLVLNLVGDFLRSAYLKPHEKDVPAETQLWVNMCHIERGAFSDVRKLIIQWGESGLHVKLEPVMADNYRLTIVGNSVYQVLNGANVLFTIVGILNGQDFVMTKELAQKGVAAINAIGGSYYVRYLFASRLLGRRLFGELRDTLTLPNMLLHFGDTSVQRKEFYESEFLWDHPVVDIGCGDGSNGIAFAHHLKRHSLEYHGVDIDEAELARFRKKIKREGLKNIHLYTNLDDCVKTLGTGTQYDVLITEVVEHFPVEEEAREFIAKALREIPYHKVIITTPNREFNKHYLLDGFRHHDHHREYDREEFQAFFESCIRDHGLKLSYRFVPIGDQVDGISVSQGVIVEKN